MVLENPVTAIGAAAIVFFILLGVFYLLDVTMQPKTWFGIVFVLLGVTILMVIVGQAGVGGITIAIIAALVAKGQLESRGFVK